MAEESNGRCVFCVRAFPKQWRSRAREIKKNTKDANLADVLVMGLGMLDALDRRDAKAFVQSVREALGSFEGVDEQRVQEFLGRICRETIAAYKED